MQKVTFNSWNKKRNSISNNWWKFECRYPDGTLKWREVIHNLVVDEGLYYALDVNFMGGTTYTNWYVALFESDSTPVAGWDYAGINSDQTECTDYDEVTRPQWSPVSITSLSLTAQVTFTASLGTNTTLYGAYVINVSTKGDNSSGVGIMWCATRFSTARPFVSTEQLNVTYAINSQDV